MTKAVGFFEVLGYSVALASMDKACKNANITIEGIDVNNPVSGDQALIPVVVQVKFSGEVSDVKVALEAAVNEASKYIEPSHILTHMIPSSMEQMDKLLKVGKVKLK